MAQFEIIVGSVLGASEYVAEALQQELENQTHQVNLHFAPDLLEINQQAIWLICSSTHGAGDLPDNIQPFIEQVKNVALDNLEFLIVGLGDSSYDTFCFAAQKIEDELLKQNAKLLTPSLHIDVLNHPIPEDVAVEWLKNWLSN
ncbi:FMN-binding protein MioC [Paraglaciecola aquimarina]|uniref:FMN-binding protein MioC n=1 Tax=Paraglaciecola algarum TaxID=3050085 RepID=A0ABS9D459_9ALTE|nr:FMN-binding protein MioC [Paraglaciecola sp. G1-23]MCF2947205.1 FMN-binding protein MioC [Paraglaciecola sp. G1-23]